MKPLIVMGMGRSGTRYFADILSAHKDVLLYGEIPHSSMSKFISLMDDLDKAHGRDSVRLRKWKEKKLPFILEAFNSMAMGGSEDNKEKYCYVGHKTPRSEMFFKSYEKHFRSSGASPIYFYCIRNPVDVWKSFKNMPWNVFESVDSFIECYDQSYSRYIEASRIAKGRVHLLNLDEYKRDSDPEAFLEDKVFSPLELRLDEDFARSLLEKENRNSSESFLGKGPEAVSQEDFNKIVGGKGLREIIEKNFPWML